MNSKRSEYMKKRMTNPSTRARVVANLQTKGRATLDNRQESEKKEHEIRRLRELRIRAANKLRA
jgi:hypothetical protein